VSARPSRAQFKMLDTIDPYLSFYTYEKSKNPDKRMVWLQFRADVIKDIDRLLELAHGKREDVKTANDWEVLDELFKFFVNRWPKEFVSFKESVELIRRTRNPGGKSNSKEIMYLGALPSRLERLIKTMFPNQKFDKPFMYKLVKRYKLLKVYKENN
jgi:hypothetical protein